MASIIYPFRMLAGKHRLFRPLPVVLFLTVILFSLGIRAQEYSIYPGNNDKNEIEVKVSDSSHVSFLLTKKSKEADTVSLVLSSFKGDGTGDEIEVSLRLFADTTNYRFSQFLEDTTRTATANDVFHVENLIFDKAALPFSLVIPKLPSYQVYKGHLIINRFQEEVESFAITLLTDPEFPAELAVDLPSSHRQYTRPFWRETTGPRFVWHVYEKARKEQLRGVYAVLQEYASSNNYFYPKKDLMFSFNDSSVRDFWGLDPAKISSRRIEIGEQAKVEVIAKPLPAGEYSAKIRLTSANAKAEGAIVVLSFKIKDHWVWAVIVLTLAIAFSFITNKWLNTRRQKLEIRNKVTDLYPAWLRLEPPSLGAVKARSTLKLVEELSRKLYIPNREIIDQKLEEVKVLIKYLDRSRQLRKKIEQYSKTDMKYRRAMKHYRRISDKIGSDKIDEVLGTEIEAGLEKLEEWFLPGQFDVCYGKSLEADVQHLKEEIGTAQEFPKKYRSDLKDILNQLDRKIKENPGTVEVEDLYAVAKVLWERRDKPEVINSLMKNYQENGSVNLLFNEVDHLEWDNLKRAHSRGELKFISPSTHSLGRTETFQPLWFSIFPENDEDANNYLFKHGLRYQWEIKITPHENILERALEKLRKKLRKRVDEKLPKLEPRTSEPKVVQFIPFPSEINYQVTLYYTGRRKAKDSLVIRGQGPLKAYPSTIFSINKAFKNIELFALLAAWLVAGISGLLTFYYKNDTFGQVSDYLTLFLWGAGVDQTKNFIQNLQVYTKKSDATNA